MKKYRSSEIIFGTRKKLLDLREKLELLEKLTVVQNKKNVKKVMYQIVPSSNQEERDKGINQRFICNLFGNRSLLQDTIDYLKSGYLYKPTILIDSAELDKDYVFNNNEFNQSVSITDQNRFKEIIEEIKSSDFFNEMAFKKICTDKDNIFNFVKLGCNGIQICYVIKDNKYGELFYNPKTDSIESNKLINMELFPRKITEKEVQELLDVEVDGSLLSDYQRSMIDNSESAKKPIIIDSCNEKIAYYGIEETDSIHLVKRKRNSFYI